ncbi:hypothetical protein [Legionella clemsonensis]|uniref:Uncharacterized protein n=1 Tax=Legionella clemsonensis TaxID=1867846 RepID=A0A222P3Y0_9GAMM|nr:hypothetical protein [Legionella clemsonensis]ASQ46542.1 hypothetical protein clem_09965 [Legionella clemsonensis]
MDELIKFFEENNTFYYCFGSDTITLKELDSLKEELSKHPQLFKICLDKLHNFSITDVTETEDKMLDILLSLPMFTNLEISCGELDESLDAFLESVFRRAVHIKHIDLNFGERIENHVLQGGFPGFIDSIGKSVTSYKLDIDTSFPVESFFQLYIHRVIEKNLYEQGVKQTFTEVVSNKISSFIDKVHSIAIIPDTVDYIKLDFNEIKQFFTTYINFIDEKQIDSLKEKYGKAVFELASYYLAKNELVECCSFLINEKSTVSNEPLFVIALFDIFKEKKLLIKTELEEFSFAALANILKPEYSDSDSSIEPKDLLIAVFLQIQKKRNPSVAAEQLQDQCIEKFSPVSSPIETQLNQQNSFFGGTSGNQKRRRLLESDTNALESSSDYKTMDYD